MHQLCFDIHHLLLTAAERQPVVPQPRKHNVGNIFRSQTFERTVHFSYMCVRVCICEFFISVNKLNELLTLQKSPPLPLPLQQERHQRAKERGYTAGSTHHRTQAWIIRPRVTPITEVGNGGGLTLPFM